jgi:glycerol uptake facilitator-like aquaporin
MGVMETAASSSHSAPEFIDNLMTLNFWRAAAAELLGSFFLTLIVCGASIDWSASSRDADDAIHAALASGLGLATVHFAMRHVSGGHLNPAVTVAMATTRRTSIVRALIYIIAQCAGAALGALTVAALTPRDTRGLLGATTLTEGLLASQGLGVECVISFVLVLTFFKTNDFDERTSSFAGCSSISLGLAAVACNLFAVRIEACLCWQ